MIFVRFLFKKNISLNYWGIDRKKKELEENAYTPEI